MLRLFGWILIAGALYALWLEGSAYWDTGVHESVLAGAYWYMFSPGSLNFIQAIIQRYLLPELWDPVIVTVLLWPAWAVLGAPGLAIEWWCRRRNSRHHRFRS